MHRRHQLWNVRVSLTHRQALNTEFRLDPRLWTRICTNIKCDMTMMSLSPPTDCTAALSGFIQKYRHFHAKHTPQRPRHARAHTHHRHKNMTSTCDNSEEKRKKKNSLGKKRGDIKWAASGCANGSPGAFQTDFCKCLQVNKQTNKDNKYASTTAATNDRIYPADYLWHISLADLQ